MSQVPNSARNVIVSQESLTEDDDAVLFSNVTVVNAMFSEHIAAEEISEAALRSYYVDFYASQMAAGGFANFIYTSSMDEDVIGYITAGLEEMGATGHLALFKRFLVIFENLDDDAQEYFLNEELLVDDDDIDFDDDAADDEDLDDEAFDAENTDDDDLAEADAADEGDEDEDDDDEDAEDLYEDEFDDLDEEFAALSDADDLTALNASWLRAHPDLKPLPADSIEEHVAQLASEIPGIEERRSLAEAELAEGLEDYELLIIELADVAEQDLEEILGHDEDFSWDGEPASGWRFRTNEGEFIMLEDDEHALMIDVATHEIIAELEFEDED